jgi:hypothetical protein
MHSSRKFLFFIVAAAAAAAWLAYFSHVDLDLPRHVVRADALLSAAGLGGFLILFLYSGRFGKRQ